MTEGVIGLGTLLKIGDGDTPEVFAAIAEVKDITGPGLAREFAEFTHQQSEGGYREYNSLSLAARGESTIGRVPSAVEADATRRDAGDVVASSSTMAPHRLLLAP